MTGIWDFARAWLDQRRVIIPLLAFAVPLIVRLIPEVLMGPYLIGFDTMGFYVPNTLMGLNGNVDLWSYIASAPLFYSILFSTAAVGVPLTITLKVIPPLLLGFLGLSVFLYARKGLGWSPVKSLVPALLGTVYFVALRVSWDMLRSELGLIFLFVTLTLLIKSERFSRLRFVILSLAMLAVVLSHQLVAVIMFGAVFFTVVHRLFRKDLVRSLNLFVVSLPSLLFFVIVYLLAVAPSGFTEYSGDVQSALATWTGFASYESMLVNELGFFLYCFLPLLPLAIASFRRLNNLHLRSWLILSLFLLLIPFAFVSPFRWLLLLMYPLAFYTTETLSRLRVIKWKRFGFTMRRLAVLYLVLSTATLSLGYLFSAPESPFLYFNREYTNTFVYQIPSSMLQNTVSVRDCPDVAEALDWFKSNVDGTAVLLTHRVFYGWALLSLEEGRVVNYDFGDPVESALEAVEAGNDRIFLIWWTGGDGWYGQPTLPLSFQEVYRSGKIAIYAYLP